MYLIIVLCLAAVAFGAVVLGFVPPPNARTLVRMNGGSIRVVRGSLRSHARDHVSDILTDAKVSKGFIAITSGNRVTFSRTIPSAIHQRLRNVLLNQWV